MSVLLKSDVAGVDILTWVLPWANWFMSSAKKKYTRYTFGRLRNDRMIFDRSLQHKMYDWDIYEHALWCLPIMYESLMFRKFRNSLDFIVYKLCTLS